MEKILIIDDDSEMQSVLSDILKSEGYEPLVSGDGRKALRYITDLSPALVLLDIRLPGMDGMKVLEKIRQTDKRLIVIMLTGYGDIKDAVQAIKMGAFDYITKPFRNQEIVSTVRDALLARLSCDAHAVTPREKEVLAWLKEGKSSRDISLILGISDRTVNFHINNVMHKLNAVSRMHAVAIAVEKAIIDTR
ncbi:MAG: response regulator [Nitrospiraceae bacterium]|nr:MAG: response regulator [Nitrospiraceae bacterium]